MKCKNCKNRFKRRDDDGTLYDWCGMIVDSPDAERERQCKYYSVASNADRIRSMSDKELSVFLYGLVNEFGSMNHDCLDFNYCKVHSGEYRYEGWLDWLKQEVEK